MIHETISYNIMSLGFQISIFSYTISHDHVTIIVDERLLSMLSLMIEALTSARAVYLTIFTASMQLPSYECMFFIRVDIPVTIENQLTVVIPAS